MWRGFLTGRVMVALALLFLQGLGQFINLAAEPATLAVCVAYLPQKHLGQPRQHLQTSREVIGIGLDDQRRVSGQRLGIDGRDED